MKPTAALVLVAMAAALAGGCVVRTGRSHHAVYGHPASHRHDHCHHRGGKHDKRVCHDHPHGPGHH